MLSWLKKPRQVEATSCPVPAREGAVDLSATADPADRRRAKRHPLVVNAYLEIYFPDDKPSAVSIRAQTEDVTGQGIKVTTRSVTHEIFRKMMTGRRKLKIELQSADGSDQCTIHGEAVYINFNNRRWSAAGALCEVGITFDPAPPEELRAAQDFLSRQIAIQAQAPKVEQTTVADV